MWWHNLKEEQFSYVGSVVFVAIMIEIVTTETKMKTDMVEAAMAVAVIVVVAEMAEAEAVACIAAAINEVKTMHLILKCEVHSTIPHRYRMASMEFQINQRHMMTKENLRKLACTTVAAKDFARNHTPR